MGAGCGALATALVGAAGLAGDLTGDLLTGDARPDERPRAIFANISVKCQICEKIFGLTSIQ